MYGEEVDDYLRGKKPNYKKAERKSFKMPKKPVTGCFEGLQYDFEMIGREEWGAKPPLHQDVFSELMADVIVTFTDTDECNNVHECIKMVKKMQTDHMKDGQPDIRHNFLIGGDGHVYEGRGWHTKPPPLPDYPEFAHCSINIAYIGMSGNFPRVEMAKVMFQLVDFASRSSCLQENVNVCAHYFDLKQKEMSPELAKHFYDQSPIEVK